MSVIGRLFCCSQQQPQPNAIVNTSAANTPALEELIRSLKAEQIEVLAKEIIKVIMKLAWIETTSGKETEVVIAGTKCKTYSEMSDAALLPIIKKQIAEAFSTPNSFLKEGIKLNLYKLDNSGILQGSFSEFIKFQILGLNSYQNSINVASCILTISLKTESASDKELSFNILPYMNGEAECHYGYIRKIEMGLS